MASSSGYRNTEKDIPLLVVQFLDEHNLTDSARMLEKEGRFIFNMKYVEEAVKDGKWKELENYVLHFSKIDENPWSTKLIFEIRKHKYIEALDSCQYAKALEILTSELQPIVHDKDVYNEFAQLICLNNVRENEKIAEYYSNTENVRRSIFIHLKTMIEMNPVLKDKLNYPILMEDSRLKVLMNQSLNWQHLFCEHPEANPTISTLYVDHTCGDAVVPSLNDGYRRGLGYLTPCKTDEKNIPEIKQAHLYSLRLPDPILSSKIDRITYDNSGHTIFALSCSGVLKFWKLKVEETNAKGEAPPRIICEHSGFLANDTGARIHELVVPCFALSKNDFYVASASGGKVSLFGLQASGSEFRNLTTIMSPPPAATSIMFYPEDNNLIIFGMEDGSLRIYDVRTDEVKAQIKAHDQMRVTGLAYSSALNILVSSAYNAEICSWRSFALIKQSSIFVDIRGCAVSPGHTSVKFHQNQMQMLVVHANCLVTLEGPDLKPTSQWAPSEPICDAAYSCDGHTIYASFIRGHVNILDSASFTTRCIINPSAYMPLNPSSVVYGWTTIAAHPSKPNQFALGLSDGCAITVEPGEGDWPGRPQIDNVAAA